jgi:phytoene desaturase
MLLLSPKHDDSGADTMRDVAIIGTGLGGIAAAARLARHGYRVRVYEKQPKPGGRCGQIRSDGFTFDMGATLYLMPRVFEETFAALGESLSDHLTVEPLAPTYRIHFHDGSTLDLTPDLLEMRRQLEAMEPGSFQAYLRFMAQGYDCQETSLEHFVGRNFLSILDYLSPANLPRMLRLKALSRHYDFTAKHFQDPRLRAAFSFQNMYLGLSPYEAMATYALLQYSELAEGVWYPRGGLYAVVQALVGVAESLGVEFHYDAPVAQIEVSGRSASGLVLESGERVVADIVVANAEVPYVYSALLPDDGTTAKLCRKRFTSSAIMFYWGIEGARCPELLHHNVFVTEHRYRESFDRIFRDLTLPDEPSFYVCAPSRTEPKATPEAADALTVLVPVGHMDTRNAQDWDALTRRARSAVLAGLSDIGIADVEERVISEQVLTPPDWQRQLNLPRGSAFGLSHNFGQVGYFRPHNRHARYGNLYFVGASTHPGTGLPLVLLSAKLTTERILHDHGSPTGR